MVITDLRSHIYWKELNNIKDDSKHLCIHVFSTGIFDIENLLENGFVSVRDHSVTIFHTRFLPRGIVKSYLWREAHDTQLLGDFGWLGPVLQGCQNSGHLVTGNSDGTLVTHGCLTKSSVPKPHHSPTL